MLHVNIVNTSVDEETLKSDHSHGENEPEFEEGRVWPCLCGRPGS